MLRHALAVLRQRFPSAALQLMRVEKIVSGGQTGADQAALDVALERGLKVGGWVPKGRLAEDGPIPERYSGLVETQSSDPAVRTSLNVRDSDATLIVSHGPLTGGSLLTLEEARRWRKPVLHLDLHEATPETAVSRLRKWLDTVSEVIAKINPILRGWVQVLCRRSFEPVLLVHPRLGRKEDSAPSGARVPASRFRFEAVEQGVAVWNGLFHAYRVAH